MPQQFGTYSPREHTRVPLSGWERRMFVLPCHSEWHGPVIVVSSCAWNKAVHIYLLWHEQQFEKSVSWICSAYCALDYLSAPPHIVCCGHGALPYLHRAWPIALVKHYNSTCTNQALHTRSTILMTLKRSGTLYLVPKCFDELLLCTTVFWPCFRLPVFDLLLCLV